MEHKKEKPVRVVIALGGNALQNKRAGTGAEAQLKTVRETCEYLAEISVKGFEIAIAHGNGPQVGQIVMASEAAADTFPVMPFDVCDAMSQGYIGYHLQQGLKYALNNRNRNIPVLTIVTQVVVEKDDPAFRNPTKPIGPFYTEEEARALTEERGYVMKEDAGRGFRRVVASPIPRKIVEIDSVRRLWDSTVVITVGGGGIPVIEKENGVFEGVAAVIDKDFAAEKLAEDVDADILMILTEVDRVFLNYGKPNEKALDHMSVAEVAKYIKEGHFAEGSMLPKVRAAAKFVRANPTKKAIITSLYKGTEALEGKAGTLITFAK
ncbi:MAG: carbamate kinase [Clostridiales Family XIII bacterium]|jgi:carbamate kinase|nr:carbamate kinase [Clostridiales Family XIII bacterium]